jgi:hypothetical protein
MRKLCWIATGAALAVEDEPAIPLEPGQTYGVGLARWTGPGATTAS